MNFYGNDKRKFVKSVMSDLNIHRPHHDSMNLPGEYFITGRMVDDQRLLASDERKLLFFDVLVNLCHRHNLDLIAWMIADNHYHVLVSSGECFKMGALTKSLHSATSKLFNDEDQTPGRRVWHQYWDRRIRDEQESWKVFNYNHWNPIKHGYVKTMNDLAEYPFSSYPIWLELLGQEVVEIFFESYPIEDFDPFN